MLPPDLTKRDAIYRRLRTEFASRRDSGIFERLPGELELARRFAAGRVTVRAALERLEQEGVIRRIRGKGTFLAPLPGAGNRVLVAYHETLDITASSNYIMPGIQRRYGECGLQADLMPLGTIRFAGVEHSCDMFRERRYRGVILLGHCYRGDEIELEVFRKLRLPVVLPHGVPEDADVTGFATCYYPRIEGVLEAVRYLVASGKKRFATFYDWRFDRKTPMGFSSCEEYCRAIAKLGADPSEELLFGIREYTDVAAGTALDALFQRTGAPRTVFCHSDFCALNLYKVAARRKLRIPGDIGIMGFCGFPGGNLLAPPLATIDLMYDNIGSSAVDMLNNAAEWFGKSVPCVATPYQLVKGESI